MEITKASKQDKEFFRSLLPDAADVEIKPMFGNIGAFVHGNMFAGLFGAAVGVRLNEADQAELAGFEGSGPFGPAERAMGGYLSLPQAWRAEPETAAGWVAKAFAHVSSMPAKVKKPKKAQSAKTRS